MMGTGVVCGVIGVNMSMPGSAGRNPDEDYRLVHDELNDIYFIQKKGLFKFKTIDFQFDDYEKAKERLVWLRKENRKTKIGKHLTVLED